MAVELQTSDAGLTSGFRQDQLAQVQRVRILAGAVQVVDERGAANTAIAEIVQRAGVSRRTFYELFADRDDCIVAALDDALAMATARVLPAVESQRGWLAKLRAGVVALMGFLDEEPQLGRLLVCESAAGSVALARWRDRVTARLVAFIDEGREQGHQGQRGRQVPAMQADGSVGGALTILAKLLCAEDAVSFTGLSGSLVSMIAMPYLGHAVARRELDRPAPAPPTFESSQTLTMPVAPLTEAGMRLTYRTLRVLLAIAGRPGASNREVGDLAEIADQGQASKLLRRLQRAGLISNDGVVPGQGAPNAWQLTATGQRLADSVRGHTDLSNAGMETVVPVAPRAGEVPVGQKGSSHNSRRVK